MQTAPTGKESTSGDEKGTSKPQSTAPAAPRRRSPEEDPTDYWSYELFGCLTDWRICCATFFVPCYTVGRNAAYFGDDGAATGILYGLGLLGVCIYRHTAAALLAHSVFYFGYRGDVVA